MMDASVREFVRGRAHDQCEYCRLAQQDDAFFTFHLEHIVPLQHGGQADRENLAWSCPFCNRYKGPNLAGLDPDSGEITRLYHPRRDDWNQHFLVRHGMLIGLTDVGRTTVQLLRMNDPLRVALRREAAETAERPSPP